MMKHQTSAASLTRHFYADGVEITEQLAAALIDYNRSQSKRTDRIPVLVTEEDNPSFDGDAFIWAAIAEAVEEQEVLDNDAYIFTREGSPMD